MATSVIEICNRALGRIGIDQLIESLDDQNNRARNCKLQYEPCRDEVLQDFPWNFAQIRSMGNIVGAGTYRVRRLDNTGGNSAGMDIEG